MVRVPWTLLRTARVATRRGLSNLARSKSEKVTVKCRSSGSVDLQYVRPPEGSFHADGHGSISHPLSGSSDLPVLLYIPPGPIYPGSSSLRDEEISSALCASARAIVVRINYRLSRVHPYPNPVHDVLAGYDWTIEHLLGKRPSVARLGVCGSLIGGGLASVLALTECHIGGHRVAAAAVNNPITDWAFPSFGLPVARNGSGVQQGHQLSKPASRSKKAEYSKWNADGSWWTNSRQQGFPESLLAQIRRRSFRRPDQIFDPFASPILFFRSSDAALVDDMNEEDHEIGALGDDLPLTEGDWHDHDHGLTNLAPGISDSPAPHLSKEALKNSEAQTAEESFDDHSIFSDLILDHETSEDLIVEPQLVSQRWSHRAHPPLVSDLQLPDFFIQVGERSVLRDQGVELAALAMKSLTRTLALESAMPAAHSDDSTEWSTGRSEISNESANPTEVDLEQRIKLGTLSGTGLWTSEEAPGNWRTAVEEAGGWMRQRLAS